MSYMSHSNVKHLNIVGGREVVDRMTRGRKKNDVKSTDGLIPYADDVNVWFETSC